jgi:hypothetical protein
MNPKSREDSAAPTFVEDDFAKTQMDYGSGKGPLAKFFVGLVWAGFVIGLTLYLVLYYFPDLAEWRAW